MRVLAVVLGVFAAAAVAEVALSVTHWGVWEPRQADYHFVKRESDAFWVADPAHPPEHVWDGDPYDNLPPGARMTYPLNSAGLRGPEPDPFLPKVLFVGDSFTFGEGVAYEDTFVARIDRDILSRAEPPMQAIDAGMPGYGTAEQAARLPDFLGQYSPRAVVVVYVPNDPIPLDEELERGGLLVTTTGAGGPRIFRLLAGAWRGAGSDRAVEDWYHSYYFGAHAARWAAARSSLDGMRRRCADSGAAFGVVVFPILHRLSERPFRRIHDAVAAACRETGVPVLDLTDALTGPSESELWVHPTDHHPNARAHRLAAEAMGPFVKSLVR
jgi:lysophospholipase L1-like esterase